MCGRLNIYNPELIDEYLQEFEFAAYPHNPARYNVAPQSIIPVLTDVNHLLEAQWGIEFGHFRHPNSKASTIRIKPHLQFLLEHHRCVIPVNRFYEWPDPKTHPHYQGIKTRFCIHNKRDVLLLAGIYKYQPEKQLTQFNVVTTDPTSAIAQFHHRSPVILTPQDAKVWLVGTERRVLEDMMIPSTQSLQMYECDPWVDNARHDGSQCMRPV